METAAQGESTPAVPTDIDPTLLDPDAVKDEIEALLRDFRAETESLAVSLPRFLAAHGAIHTGGDIDARWREHALALVDELVEPLPGARELIATLRERDIAVAVLTNGWSPLQERKLAKIGYVGALLVSGALGVAKPQRLAFDRLAQTLDVALQDCWYVGDTPLVDVVGARLAGMHGVWFDWEGHTWPSGVAAPEARITRLADFLALIPGSGAVPENSRSIEWHSD